MAHFAQLDSDNNVTNVIKVNNDVLLDDGNESEAKGIAFLKSLYGADTIWKQTSYNTKCGVYYNANSTTAHADQSKVFRRTFAAIGGIYDPDRNAFTCVKPYPSWVLNQTTGDYDPPVSRPTEVGYIWDEDTTSWVKL